MSINLWYCKKCDKDFETKRNSSKNTMTSSKLYEPPDCPRCGSGEVEWIGFSTIFAQKK